MLNSRLDFIELRSSERNLAVQISEEILHKSISWLSIGLRYLSNLLRIKLLLVHD
jgi:hypothetical protein